MHQNLDKMSTKSMRVFRFGGIVFLLSLFSVSSFAGEITDISFTNPGWLFTDGVTYDAATEELTIIGDTDSYRYAQLTTSIPNGTSDVYLSGDVYLENIVLGGSAWFAPKIKISNVGAGSIKAENLSSPAQGSWYTAFVRGELSGQTQVVLEFGFQNSSGTFIIKNPKVSDTEPIPTPYSFPYTVPADPSCSLDLESAHTVAFNNDLLSTNCHFSWASKSWGDLEVVDAINSDYPMTNYRFPGGTVGNFYDWTTDGYHDDPSTFESNSRYNLFEDDFRFDYPGFRDQVLSASGSATLMFNVLHDDITTASNRLQSRLTDGLDIKWVELGNENFYGTQSYGFVSGGLWQVSDVEEYINHTSALTTALKGVSPDTKYAVCLNHHDFSPGGWTDRLSEESYYDATTMHNYNNVGSESLDFSSGSILLNSYKITRSSIEEYKTHFGRTPTVITEWGVLGSKSFLSVVSAADMFLALLEGSVQDSVVMQTGIHMFYHSDNNQAQSLILLEGGVVKHTPMGCFYAKLFDVFKNRSIYTDLSVSEEIEAGLPGVISKAVDLGDSIQVFTVNKLPVASPLNLTFDGMTLEGGYKMETYSMSPELWPDALENPNDAWTETTGTGVVSLPAYSLTVTTIAKTPDVASILDQESEMNLVAYPNPTTERVFLKGVVEGAIFEVVDVAGLVLLSDNYSSEGVDINEFPIGQYLIRVNGLSVPVYKK